MSSHILLAAVQDAPQAFDLEASIQRLSDLTRQAAEQARSEWERSKHYSATSKSSPPSTVVVFPEAFLCAYPRGYDFGAKVGSRNDEGRAWWSRYHASSVPVADLEGPTMRSIRACASDSNVTLVVGVIERCNVQESGKARAEYGSSNPGGRGTLYCEVLEVWVGKCDKCGGTALTISPTGEMLSSHRKLMPTGSERLIWGQGDGAGVRVVDTPAGKVGAVICWENYMPLHRMALYSMGIEIYAAPTADTRDGWQSSMRHIATEGRCVVVSVCQFAQAKDHPSDWPGTQGLGPEEVVTRGGSVIVGPMGQVLAGPLFDSRGILTAVVAREELRGSLFDLDAGGGHYSRPDIFSMTMNDRSTQAFRTG